MSSHVVTVQSTREIDRVEWEKVCPEGDDLLMSLRFLEAVEASMGEQSVSQQTYGADARFWFLLAYQDNQPVGAACVAEYPFDSASFANPFVERVVGSIRKLIPRYLKFRITFCGLPVSTAGSNLRILPGVDAEQVVAQLNAEVERIARQRRTWLIVYKEFDEREAERFDSLKQAHYTRADSLPMNRIENRFANFEKMLGAMRSHYRYKITKSRKKFAASGLQVQRISGAETVREIYTPQLHALYEQVTRRAEHRLEILPREFFLELAERFSDALILTTIACEGTVLAFAWSMRHGDVYRNLFVGLDYFANEQTDAYFNLMVEDITHALDEPVREILVGQTADEFKSRLGCTSDRRIIYVKITQAWLRWCFLRTQRWFIPPLPAAPEREVFKTEPAKHSAEESVSTP